MSKFGISGSRYYSTMKNSVFLICDRGQLEVTRNSKAKLWRVGDPRLIRSFSFKLPASVAISMRNIQRASSDLEICQSMLLPFMKHFF